MRRDKLIAGLVLNEITDDYESAEHIVDVLQRYSGEEGFVVVNAEEITRALLGLVQAGLARAYRITFSSLDAVELRADSTPEDVAPLHFYITEEGRVLQSSEEHSPFDDEGNLKQEWRPTSSS
jgi:hypothetical protein